MGIKFDELTKTFHLQAKNTSYIFKIVKSGWLAHLYWGNRLNSSKLPYVLNVKNESSFSPNPDPDDRLFSFDTLPQEYPAYGTGDFRHPAYQVQLENGSTITDLRYQAHRIIKGKPPLKGLPATYAESQEEAETLELHMLDSVAGLRAILSYSVFEDFDCITRSVRFINEGKQELKLLRALSMSVDFPVSDYDMLQLSGAWARERHLARRKLGPGCQSIESRRGSSSHQQNPFIALLSKNACEDYGEVYGFSLVYSGSFIAQAEVDQFESARISIGINPFDFSWLLKPGEEFQTPEAVCVYSANGLGGMSRIYHDLYRQRLCRGKFRDTARPILVNNWEATYFDFTSEKILEIARMGKELGIELFVLDDGWFGKRNDDKSSLGDWFVNAEKLPEGIDGLAEKINKLGMKFGLWFEPEMISPDSKLYREHPDWCLHVPSRDRTEGRNQLVLDFSREDVCNTIVKMLKDILSSAPVSYVKWDMNRNMTEIGSAGLPAKMQRETAHRYMLGLYRVLEEITSGFPDILFESCSGGGGRFDPGMLYYMPQTWTSDNTDAVERLKIQYGTSIVYPIVAMGAHVSAVPNHQVHRITSFSTRGITAMSGNLGYELDLTKLSEEEKHIVKEQVSLYKEIRHIIQFGDFFRLLSPFEGNETAWMFVTKDKSEACVMYFKVLSQAHEPFARLRLKGLSPDNEYRISGIDESFRGGESFSGDALMHSGIVVPDIKGDFRSFMWKLSRV